MSELLPGEDPDFIMEFERENIPEELRRRRQWVNHDGRKIPHTPGTKRRADSTDSETWRSFEEAVADGRGLGFVFTSGDPYTGVDLDKCRDPKTGAIEPWARAIVEDLDGYTEVSPSGTGLHVIVRGKLPVGNNRRGHVEAYSSERYFTATGAGVGGKEEVPERQEALERFHREHLEQRVPPHGGGGPAPATSSLPTDDQVLEKLLREASGKGRALFAGDVSGYESHSSADQAFMNKLYFYTQDEGQIDAIFRRSGLYREKWNRHDYRRRTYMKAANTIVDTYEWTRAKITVGPSNPANLTNLTYPTNPANPANPTVKSAAKLLETEMQPTRWAVPGVLPEGVSLLAGKPKQGKSWMALGLCESIAAGGVALGNTRVEKGEALYLALEDNERRMQKRLKKVLDGRPCPPGLHYAVEWPRLQEGGTEALEGWLSDTPAARIVVVDTLQKVRTAARGQNVYAEDYAALESLLPLAARYGVAIVVVHHLRKGEAADPQDEISGSTGLSGGVDGYMILRRKPGSKGPTLYVDGRDIEEPEEYALHWNHNTAGWTIEGTAEEVHLSQERADILLALNRSPEPMAPKETADLLGRKANNVKYLMWQMAQDGQLAKPAPGKYEPANRTNPTTNRETPHGNADNDTSVSRVSGVSQERPVSCDLEPGESATVEELRARRRASEDPLPLEDVRAGMLEARSGPGLACKTYLERPSEKRLEYLTKAVLIALGRAPEGWQTYAGEVRELAKDYHNHPVDCECEACA